MSISGLGVAVKCAAGCMYYRVRWASPLGSFFISHLRQLYLLTTGKITEQQSNAI